MIAEWIAQNGGWAWIAAGLLLLGVEIMAPGVFAMWVGFAAIAVGTITLADLSLGWWSWQGQGVVFVALSFLFAVAARRTISYGTDEGADDLNQPTRRLMGRTATVFDAIEGGEGRVKLGDTLWRVAGPDLPTGTRVRVTGEHDGRLIVEPATALAPPEGGATRA